MPGWARPVRIFCSSPFNDSTDLAILASAFFLMSAMLMINLSLVRSHVDERTLVLALHHPLQRAGLEDAEHLDRQLLVTAQREGGTIHHLQVAADRFVKRDGGVALGLGVLLGIGGVDAVDLGGLQHDLGADLGTPQGRRGIRREEGVAGAGRKDDDLALFQILQRLGPHIGLDDLLDGDGGHHAGRHALLAHGVGQGQGVHHRGQHAHVIGRRTVHADRAARHAAEDIAAANDDRHLHAHLRHLPHLLHHADDGRAVDAVGVVAHQGFTGEFEQDALVRGHGVLGVRGPVVARKFKGRQLGALIDCKSLY
mmetsp:Transcript_5760/g.14066  ORF Transcript_5760/g.14066 Transcript_5760/m.14066 type:complete len:311 (-) Transcript_5760:9-941(-)